MAASTPDPNHMEIFTSAGSKMLLNLPFDRAADRVDSRDNTTEMPAAMRPYSIAAAPESAFFEKRNNL